MNRVVRGLVLGCVLGWVLSIGAAAVAAGIGGIAIGIENGLPALRWSNRVGQVFVVESATDLGAPTWERRVTVTTDAAQAVWADDGLPQTTLYYRVGVSTNAAFFQGLQQALQRGRTDQRITGASAAVVVPEQGLWVGTSGYSHGAVSIRPQTPFELGSVTKTFVAATILRLVEEGRLNLEDTVGEWLPTLNSANVSPAITVRQLLMHRSGVYNFGDDIDFRQALFADWARQWEPEEIFAYVKAPYFAPDAGGEYSNTGYVLLGMIIQSATGATASAEIRRTILERAGLRSTWLGAQETVRGELPHPHLDFDGDGVHEDLGGYSQNAILSSFWTSGAMIGTAADTARFGAALFAGGLLNPGSLDEMRSFQGLDIVGTYVEYGLGLMRLDVLGREHWAHSGGLFGEFAWLSYCPDTGVSLAVVYNHPPTSATGASLPGELLIALAELPERKLKETPREESRRAVHAELGRLPLLQ